MARSFNGAESPADTSKAAEGALNSKSAAERNNVIIVFMLELPMARLTDIGSMLSI